MPDWTDASLSWRRFLAWTEAVLDAGAVFRGHVHSRHTDRMLPRIGRPDFARKNLRTLEEDILSDFKRRARGLEAGIEFSNWDWLALAQHYDLPTRLLDWSESPLVAAYFAVTGDRRDSTPKRNKRKGKGKAKHKSTAPEASEEDNKDDWPEVIAIQFDPERVLDDHVADDNLFRGKGGVRIYLPPIRAARLLSQRSLFSWHADPTDPFDVEKAKTSGLVRDFQRFAINPRFREYYERRLSQFGIDHAFIRADLAGVARAIVLRLQLQQRTGE